jgi:hypothetical protein
MPHAKLIIDLPQETWISDVSTTYSDLLFEVITGIHGEDTGIGLVRLIASDPLPVIADIQAFEEIENLELLWKHDDEALLQIQTADPLPLLPVWRAGVPIRMPFEIQDGLATWEVTTSRNRLSTLQSQLDALDISFSIEYVREIEESLANQLLTDRQQEVLLSAVEQGYYQAPREATLGDVADSLSIANATCSDILHRAEGHIIHWFVAERMET